MGKSKSTLTGTYDSLGLIVKLILQIFFGYIISGAYRIVKFVERKNVLTLIVGILGLVTGIGNAILWIVDLITLLTNNKFLLFAD